MTGTRVLDPRHGTHNPTSGTPARRPGSIRRTSTVDALRPTELDRTLTLIGRGRDLLTLPSGETVTLATAAGTIQLAYTGGAVVTSAEMSPAVGGIDNLVGKVATTGFRAVIDADTDAVAGSLEYLLLDEIPVSTLVSGYAVLHATTRGDLAEENIARMRPPGPPAHGPDMCAGFRSGGTIMNRMALGKHAVVTGPDATPIVDPADPIGWHELPGLLRADAMRRWRRTDVWAEPDGLHVDSFFRDSHMAPDGVETIIHEYEVSAIVDPVAMTVLAARSVPHVLPFLECSAAGDSGSRLAGMPVADLRRQVRAEFLGPTTCTHLNDQLRGLADVRTLDGLLRGGLDGKIPA